MFAVPVSSAAVATTRTQYRGRGASRAAVRVAASAGNLEDGERPAQTAAMPISRRAMAAKTLVNFTFA